MESLSEGGGKGVEAGMFKCVRDEGEAKKKGGGGNNH